MLSIRFMVLRGIVVESDSAHILGPARIFAVTTGVITIVCNPIDNYL